MVEKEGDKVFCRIGVEDFFYVWLLQEDCIIKRPSLYFFCFEPIRAPHGETCHVATGAIEKEMRKKYLMHF